MRKQCARKTIWLHNSLAAEEDSGIAIVLPSHRLNHKGLFQAYLATILAGGAIVPGFGTGIGRNHVTSRKRTQSQPFVGMSAAAN